MATKFPIYLNNLRFYVNPTNISIKKSSQVAESKTKAGVVYQVWPDLPDTMEIKGMAYGITSFNELLRLKNAFHATQKIVPLRYKGRVYAGYLKNLDIAGDAEVPGRFTYSFGFQCINPPHFEIQDLAVGNQPSLQATLNTVGQTYRILSSSLAQTVEKISTPKL